MSIKKKIIGNNHIQERFSRLLREDALSHAYIFQGPRFLGKQTFAQRIAEDFLGGDSQQKNALYRRVIPNEKRVIDAESIRDIRRKARLGSGRKVFVIDDSHCMTTVAQNALLKILEEPRDDVLFILVTDAVGGLLPTVFSRCEKITFRESSLSDFSQAFSPQEWGRYEGIARMAFGKPGVFFSLLEDEEERRRREMFFQVFASFEKRKVYEIMQFAKRLHEQPEKIQTFLEDWIEYYRYACREGDVSHRVAYTRIEKLHTSLNTLKRTGASPRLLLESLFLSLIS